MAYPQPIQQLIREFDKMPGIGARTAERLAFYVLRSPPEDAFALAVAIRDVKKKVKTCGTCCSVALVDPCPRCSDAGRDRSRVLVVEQPHDVEAFEGAGWKGGFHVLGGALNPVEGIEPAHLTVDRLLGRVRADAVSEVVLGLDPDFEGDGTALYLAGLLKKAGVRVTRIARGIPSGSSVEYTNSAVLADAVAGRRPVEEGA